MESCRMFDIAQHCELLEQYKPEFQGRWEDKNWMNVPGAFYGAMTDTCLTGLMEAPENVLIDKDGQEIVFCQPRNIRELTQVCRAAYAGPLQGYGCDGGDQWTRMLVSEWWHFKDRLIDDIMNVTLHFQDHEEIRPLLPQYSSFAAYVNTELEQYLSEYSFYLEEGRLPTVSDVLPGL